MPAILRFDRFELHLDSGELVGEGSRVRLEPQPAKLLSVLAGRPGEVVSREELRKELWAEGTFVDFERGLSYCVRQVRSALGDSASAPRFIETLPKRGYRFVAKIEVREPREPGVLPGRVDRAGPAVGPAGREADPKRVQESAADGGASLAPGAFQGPQGPQAPEAPQASQVPPIPGQRASPFAGPDVAALLFAAVLILAAALILTARLSPAARSSAALPTLAVTLFDNETADRDLDRMAQVLTDTLVERLARAPSRWSVIGNAAILRAPRPLRNLEAIGSSLHADFIVLGQILPGERGPTVLTHLIRAEDRRHLWVGRFTSPAALDPGLPERVAESVAAATARRIGQER